jgi:DNA-binding response OmpR family regulator
MHPIKRILVVDDEPMVCALTARVLRQCGYEVIEACDGMVGYELACTQSFDLVVTDSRMPNLNGAELVVCLRLLNPTLPIIHISGSYGESSKPRDMPANVPTLFKPFDMEALKKEAERLMAVPAATP